MPIRRSVLAMSACLNTALLAGCADGGSSVTQPAGSVPAAAQGAALAAGRSVRSGVRRPLDVPSCIGFTGPHAFMGINNSSADGGAYSVVGGGQNNEACDPDSTVVGGNGNQIYGQGNSAVNAFIGGGGDNSIIGVDGQSAILAGYANQISAGGSAIIDGDSNSVAANSSFIGAGAVNTIAVGGDTAAIVSGENNSLSGEFGFIGAGSANTLTAAATYGAIAGGNVNNLSGEYGFIGGGSGNHVSAEYGVIAGGLNNYVFSAGEGGYIAAGGYNQVGGEGAVIDGGFNNQAYGTFATIPGGYVNSAGGTYSFAAGARASASQTGTFVWSDGSDGDTILTSARAYQFLARASGGVTFWTNAASTVGAQLAPGSGTWASASDRNLKTDVARIDDAAVLDKVATLPIERWSYKSERGVRHVGPMAQDFYAAFGVGADDKHITSIDEDGVALAAIKALHAENAQLRTRLATVTASHSAKIAAMQAQLQILSAQMAALRQR
jgi:hypothetical protein